MRSHRRRAPLQHVLIAGTAAEHAAIQRVLDLLTPTAYGQVLLETQPGVEAPALDAPRRITIQHVQALRDAVPAWIAEWAPEESDVARAVTIWLGTGSDAPVGTACHDLRTLVELA